jgi:hypothetical protein
MIRYQHWNFTSIRAKQSARKVIRRASNILMTITSSLIADRDAKAPTKRRPRHVRRYLCGSAEMQPSESARPIAARALFDEQPDQTRSFNPS